MRVYLKIKVVSLAVEAKLIRREEHRIKAKPRAPGESPPAAWWGLRHHRIWDVRNEARAAQLAYGFLRGRSYKQIEAKCHTPPDWQRVTRLVEKYGVGLIDDVPLKLITEWAKSGALTLPKKAA